MSVGRRWARKFFGRRCQQLLVRWISACPQDLREGLNQRFVSRQGPFVGFDCCRQQERRFLLAALTPRSKRSVCIFTVSLHSIGSAVNCLTVCHGIDAQIDDDIASLKVEETAQASSHSASILGDGMADCQLLSPVLHNLYATDGGHGALSLQESEDMDVNNRFCQASMATETAGSRGVCDGPHTDTSTGLACNFKGDSKTLGRRNNTLCDEQDSTIGSNCDNGEDDLPEMLNVGDSSGSSKPVLSFEDLQIVHDICNLLDNKGWNANVEDFLSTTYAPHLPQLVASMVIHRQSRLRVAEGFFDWVCRKVGHASFSYHAYIWKLGMNKQYHEAWELVNRMEDFGCQVSETTFCILIKAYGAARTPDMAVAVLKRMHDYGMVVGTPTFTTLISIFFKLDMIDEVLLCYRTMLVDGMHLDMPFFSTLICGFGTKGKIRDAQACFDMMLSYAWEPDLSQFNGLIQAFCCCNAMQSATATFHALQKRGLQPDASTFNMIMKAFCKDGKLEDAMSFFADMKDRDNVTPNQATYNILLQGMFAKEDFLRAIDFFKQMEKEGFVDSKSLIYLSNGLRKMEQTEELLDILGGLSAKHGFSNIEICNALIYNLSQLNELDEATKTFREMVNAQANASIPTYAIMISCYCKAQKLEEAIELLAELRGRDCTPSSFCYMPIISLLLRKNRATDAIRYLQEMQALGLDVNHITYEGLLKVTCKQGMVEDAIKICDVMMARRFTLTVDTLFELLKCLVKLRGLEFSMSCFRRMYKRKAFLDCKALTQTLAVMNLYAEE